LCSAWRAYEAAAGLRWCLKHLTSGEVIAALGVNPVGEFVLGIPPFDALDGENGHLFDVTRHYCVPLNAAGIACEPRLLPYQQGRAVMDVARAGHADL
jgi:hypothetical protein